MPERSFDVVILGAGPAGEVAAGRLADSGHDVAIVEGHLVGGECSFYACMPSKALLRPAEALAETRRIPGAREAVGGELDVAAALARRDEVIHGLSDDEQVPWLDDKGVTLIRGHGRLAGERRVSVGEETLVAREAVIVAVGSGALLPPIPGLAESAPWTSREVTTAKAIPARLVILGGGVVGCEMAQAYSSFGASVTLVEGDEGLLPREEPFAGEQVAAALAERGVDIRVGVRASAVKRPERGGEVRVELEDGGSAVGDELLVAIGRRPLTDDLGLDSVGLPPGKSIEVDDRLRVPGVDWLYAIGDVNGRALLTHVGKYHARVVAELIDGRDARATHDGAGSPRVIFTDPQVAAVGLTVALAGDAGVDALVVDHPTAATAGASFYGRDAPGTARLVIDKSRLVIVGATFTGPEVADMLHAASIAVAGEVPIAKLWEAIPSFPTRSELWLKLLEKAEAEMRAPAGASA